MNMIVIERAPSQEHLQQLNVLTWKTWKKDVSVFTWYFPEREVAYLLEGEALVTPEGGEPVIIRAQDLVTFPAGMRSHWEVRIPVRKHYRLDGTLAEKIGRRVRLFALSWTGIFK